MAKLEFFYDIISPYSYLASTAVEAIAADTGAELVWRPFLLGGVHKATGNQPPIYLPARAPYIVKDLTRWAEYYGIPLEVPADFPILTILAMRALTALDAAEVPAATHELFKAYWAQGRDVADPQVVASIVGADAVAAAHTQPIKDRLRATTDEAVARGAFGAPTFFVGDELYFGNDRLPFVEQALRRAS